MSMGGGGGSQSASTRPEYARPYVESMLGSTQKELYNYTTTPEGKVELGSLKEYKPFSTNAQDYFAKQDPLTGQVYNEAAGMQTPSQFGQATGYANQAAQGGLDSVGRAYGYGQEGFQSGRLGQGLGIAGGQYYGGMGAGYGQQGADIGLMGLRAEQTGNLIGQQAQDYARQAAAAGQNYAAQATNPLATQAYMSPYMQNVVDTQKAAAVRDYQMAMPQLSAQAAKAGAFGGSRDAIQRSEAARNLTSQLQNIQAQGQQQAFQNAQAQQQFGANLGLQGLAGAQQGLGTALQGGQLGLSGIGTALQGMQTGIQGAGMGLQGVDRQLAGTAQGMQGAQVGLQGVQGAQAGYGLANQAASNLANIGTQQQQADLSRMSFQNQLAQQQQAYNQNLINQQIQNYATAQQYPMMQLGLMSNMLHGLPMQSTSTQSYYNPVAQLGSLGATALGAYGAAGGFRGYKEGGKVQNYDVGGSVEAQLENLPDAKLAEIAKTSPSQEIRKMAARLLMEHQAEQHATGIAAAPAPNMDGMATMAGGGIVAFQNRGEVKLDPSLYSDSLGLGGTYSYTEDPELKRIREINEAEDKIRADRKAAVSGLWDSGFVRALTGRTAPDAAPVANAPAVETKKDTTSVKTEPTPAAPVKTEPAPAAPRAPVSAKKSGLDAIIADYDKFREAAYGKEDPEAAKKAGLAQINQARRDLAERKDQDFWQSIMAGGLRGMQSKGNLLAAIGEGGEAGLKEYAGAQKAQREEQKLLLQQQVELEKAEEARKSGRLKDLMAHADRLENIQARKEALAIQNTGRVDLQNERLVTQIKKDVFNQVLAEKKIDPMNLQDNPALVAGIEAEVNRRLANDPIYMKKMKQLMGGEYTGPSAGPSLQEQAAAILANRKK